MTNDEQRTEAEPAEESPITIERDLPHRPDKVWRALTERRHLSRWLRADDAPGGEAHEGERFAVEVDDEPGEAEVVRLEPPRRMDLRLIVDGARSDVRIDLTPTIEGGTRLRVVHRVAAAEPERRMAA